MIVHTEARHHFIENKQAAVFRRDVSQALQKSRLRRNDAHVARHRLHDNSCQLFPELLEGKLDGVQIIVRHGDGVHRYILGYTWLSGNPSVATPEPLL